MLPDHSNFIGVKYHSPIYKFELILDFMLKNMSTKNIASKYVIPFCCSILLAFFAYKQKIYNSYFNIVLNQVLNIFSISKFLLSYHHILQTPID